MVVSSLADAATHEVADANDARVHMTNVFWDRGADFNKWAALEEGLDAYGRHDWLVIMDADVFWPREVPDYERQIGCLYTPLRRDFQDLSRPPPLDERDWPAIPLHGNQEEWAGYTQIFHADDPHLGPPPWHETDWRHAGGADSLFQRKWPPECKIRPPFEVLHYGPHGTNWCGRASPFLNGDVPEPAAERRRKLAAYMRQRRKTRNFSAEKLKKRRK